MFQGCGNTGGVKTIPVTAAVTYKGQPVADATIAFNPAGGGAAAAPAPGGKITPALLPHPAHGRTDASGKAKMWTIEPGDGVQPGSYTVIITKLDKDGKNELPAKNDLTFTAKEGGPTTAPFDLKD
jgi:hypothetical protein